MRDIQNRYLDAVSSEKYIKRCADLWRDIEYAATKYNKERTLEAADEMRDVIYGRTRYTEGERAEHGAQTVETQKEVDRADRGQA